MERTAIKIACRDFGIEPDSIGYGVDLVGKEAKLNVWYKRLVPTSLSVPIGDEKTMTEIRKRVEADKPVNENERRARTALYLLQKSRKEETNPTKTSLFDFVISEIEESIRVIRKEYNS